MTMSTHRRREWSVFIVGILGTLFSGYQSAIKFFTETCPTFAPCPYFMGYPACYVGFALFLLIALLGGLHVYHFMEGKKANQLVTLVAVLGVLFAGYYTLGDIPTLLEDGFSAYALGLPTCAYGLILYLFVLILSLRLQKDFSAV